MAKSLLCALILTVICVEISWAYSALEDARIIAEYKRQLRAKDHAKIARNLVHQANWTALGTISTHTLVKDYPMVNIISVDDNNVNSVSTGKIHFLLTDLDFTGPDWKHLNKVTLLFSDAQNQNCQRRGEDPMEPTCARTIISGQIVEMDKTSSEYKDALTAFKKRHPAAINWMHAHSFYLCELDIKNILVLDFYGGPHTVTPEEYYNAKPDVK